MPDPSTLVVEDGTAKSNANTYASLAAADNYLQDNPHTTAWSDASDEVKTWALLNATRLLDTYMRWEGDRQTETQALEWPRSGGKNRCSTLAIPDDYLPKNVTHACIELAYDLITSDKTRPSSTDQSQLAKVKVDTIELTYDTPLQNDSRVTTQAAVITDGLKAILRCYGTVAYDTLPGGVKFGRILRK
jgi:hypothetical protein